MGGRHQRRPTITYRPERNYFWAGILLCFTVGMVAAGIEESWTAGHWWWLAVFGTGEIVAIILYFWIVASWLVWMDRTSDCEPEDPDVTFPRERHHQHPGDN